MPQVPAVAPPPAQRPFGEHVGVVERTRRVLELDDLGGGGPSLRTQNLVERLDRIPKPLGGDPQAVDRFWIADMRVDPFREQPAEFLDDPGGGTMTQRDGGIAAPNGGPGRDVFKGGHEGGTTAAAKLARETALRPPSVRAPATSELTQVVPLSRERMGQFRQHHVKVSDRAEPMRQTPSLVVKGPSGHGVQLVSVDALDRPEPAQSAIAGDGHPRPRHGVGACPDRVGCYR